MTFEECWESRIDTQLGGVPVHLISREMLIRNKRSAGRPKDVADAEALDSPGGGT